MAKILFVDDDLELIKLCKTWFESRFVVDTANDVGTAIELLRLGGYDIIVLDLQLPDGSGKDIVNQVRTTGGVTPILMLTGQGEITTKVDLFDSGADDYLTKPFHFKELEARVQSLLRRPAQIRPSTLTARNLSLNLTNARVKKGDEEVILTPKEFALLEFLMRHPNQAFTQDALMQRVWTDESDASPDIVRVYITRLRKKIDDDSDSPLIMNQRGHGYIFTVEPTKTGDETV
jgi:Response regulators consisting of a CheY-like receiver domain and a winged-helix DNA-binding domain